MPSLSEEAQRKEVLPEFWISTGYMGSHTYLIFLTLNSQNAGQFKNKFLQMSLVT